MSKSLKNISIVALATVGSRLLGLLRDQLSAAIFGASELNSAFVTAFRLPNLFRRLLGEGALTAALIPTMQEEIRDSGRTGALVLLNKVASWLLVLTGAVGAVAMVVFSQSRLLSGHDDKWYLAADLTAILFPYVVMICVAAAFNATLNVFERFVEPALSPVWLNLAMIVSLGGAGWNLAHTDLGRMHWLCAGVLFGGLVQLLVPAAVLVREGWRPRLDLGMTPRLREIGLLMAPGLWGTAIYQVNVLVSGLFAYSVDDSAATLLYYSNRVMELPIGVFAIAVATVVYPLIARHASEGNRVAMGEDYRKGLRLILIVNLPAAAGLVLLSEPIVRVLFQHGHFRAADTLAMAPLLALYAIGMPFFSVVSLTTRAFYAFKDTATPVAASTASFVVNVVLTLLLKGPLGASGLVLASTVAIIVQTVYLQWALERRAPELRFGSLWASLWKVIAGVVVMSLVVAGGWRLLQHSGLRLRVADLAALLGLIPAGAAVYGVALWLLRIEGREEFGQVLGRLRGRGKSA